MDRAGSEQPQGMVENTMDGEAQVVVQAGGIAGGVHIYGPTTTPFPQPRQLPRAVTYFTGRVAELATLDALLDSPNAGSVPISVITGVGGVGKTELVGHWVRRQSQERFEGHLYVDLRGFSPDAPLPPDFVLDSFLRALDVPTERIPADLGAKAALYRSSLAGRRMLVWLDNAASSEQVRPLLPNEPNCAVLVTSRSRLAGLVAVDGARRLDLDVLTNDAAYALLANVIGTDRVHDEPEAITELARRCAYLPLFLRIAGERVASRPHLPVASFVQEIVVEHLEDDAEIEPDKPNPVTLSVQLSNHPDPSIAAALAPAEGNLSPRSEWQEILRDLDRQLAEGKITAHDYRRRRQDDLLVFTSAPPQRLTRQQAINRLAVKVICGGMTARQFEQGQQWIIDNPAMYPPGR